MPARAPASMDMLQMVMRCSIESASIAGPVYSTTCPAPPATPISPIAARMKSFAPTPSGASPVNPIRIVRGRECECAAHYGE